MRRGLSTVAVIFAMACSTQPNDSASASPLSTPAPVLVSASPSPAESVVPSAAPFDAGATCTKLCDRAAACGLELAQELAKSGDKSEKTTVEDEKKQSAAVAQNCKDQCLKVPPTREQAMSAEACLPEKECSAYTKCLDKLAHP